MALFEKLASAIRNNVVSGLQGYHENTSFTLEQIEDDIVDMRLSLLFQYIMSGKLPLRDLLLEINCIKTDCKNIEKCSTCSGITDGTPTMHFEIPQLFIGIGGNSYVEYIGSPDKQNPFKVYTSVRNWKADKYKRRKKRNKPYVYIETTPNENGMYDCWVFNAPFLKMVSVIALFKDPRLLEQYGCCDELNDDNLNFLNSDIKNKLTEQYLRYYRSGAMPPIPNDQVVRT